MELNSCVSGLMCEDARKVESDHSEFVYNVKCLSRHYYYYYYGQIICHLK